MKKEEVRDLKREEVRDLSTNCNFASTLSRVVSLKY